MKSDSFGDIEPTTSRKSESSRFKDVTILPELNTFQMTNELKMEITVLYNSLTDGKTKKMGKRRGAIYCCVISACKTRGIPFDKSVIQKNLGLTQKQVNSAVKQYDGFFGSGKVSVTIQELLLPLFESIGIQSSCMGEVLEIYELCMKKSPLFNSSKPESIAAGLVYFYLKTQLKDFNQDALFNLLKIGKDTILNIFHEIEKYVIVKSD